VAEALLPPGGFDEDAAHGLGGGGKKVRAVGERRLRLSVRHQPQVRLMHQRRRVQRVARRLGGHAGGGELP
jgi:hypothetical protein